MAIEPLIPRHFIHTPMMRKKEGFSLSLGCAAGPDASEKD